MKLSRHFIIGAAIGVMCLATSAIFGDDAAGGGHLTLSMPHVGIVNFKKCVEDSKVGKLERENFDTLRRQMESTLEAKERELSDLTKKFNDPDYLDGLSAEAEDQAKTQYRTLSQEMAQLQQQYYQTLNQTNLKIVQKLADQVAVASERVAKTRGLDVVLNEESSFYYTSTLDITKEVVDAMDDLMNATTHG